ncbi:hypothetical protein [Thalassotalea maritima]|uniref:hypothetical protein n=1 Tax=Thalassotalea maritima TaxID=3242416 RepID=UPI0035290867
MTKSQRVIDKYLQQYAESEVSLLDSLSPGHAYQQVIVIPAYKESDAFVHRFFASRLSQTRTLLIVVVNQPQTDTNQQSQELLYQQCLQLGKITFRNDNISLVNVRANNSDVLLIDRFNKPISDKHGVGLARKIGCDLAVSLINQGLITSRFIHSTDADASLPDNYFDGAHHAGKQVVAIGFEFRHQSNEPLIHQANAIYEQALRYYVQGLASAGSRYAFFTIGSTLAFDAVAYCQCRGFPKRSAGEDFYLLNKLVKLGHYQFAQDIVIHLQARTSDRVPFGTGPAVARIVELLKQQQDYHYYHPEVFTALAEVLSAFSTLYRERERLEAWYQQFPSTIVQALTGIGLDKFVNSQKTTNETQFYKQLHGFFDGFKTLKFIHVLRELAYPDTPLFICNNEKPPLIGRLIK